jgi:hypothetical protein
MAYDESLAARVRVLLPGSTIEKKMFGGLSFLLDGNMAWGVLGDDLIVRVGLANDEAAAEQPHTRPFDFTGRPMRGWIVVAPAGLVEDSVLERWVLAGARTAESLPPK